MAADPYHPSLCFDTSCNCLFATYLTPYWASLVAQTIKNLPAILETRGQSLGEEDLLENGMATHSKILAWRILWTVEPGGLHTVHGVANSQTQLSDWNFLPLNCFNRFSSFFFFSFQFSVWIKYFRRRTMQGKKWLSSNFNTHGAECSVYGHIKGFQQ